MSAQRVGLRRMAGFKRARDAAGAAGTDADDAADAGEPPAAVSGDPGSAAPSQRTSSPSSNGGDDDREDGAVLPIGSGRGAEAAITSGSSGVGSGLAGASAGPAGGGAWGLGLGGLLLAGVASGGGGGTSSRSMGIGSDTPASAGGGSSARPGVGGPSYSGSSADANANADADVDRPSSRESVPDPTSGSSAGASQPSAGGPSDTPATVGDGTSASGGTGKTGRASGAGGTSEAAGANGSGGTSGTTAGGQNHPGHPSSSDPSRAEGAGPSGTPALTPPTVETPPSASAGPSPTDGNPAPTPTPTLMLNAAVMDLPTGMPATRDATITVGHLEPGAWWWYRLDGATEWTRGVGTEISKALFQTQGEHTVEVYQMDAAGNDGAIARLTFLLDTVASDPASVRLQRDTGVQGDGISQDASLVIAGVDSNDQWFYSVDGADFVQGQGDTLPDSAVGADGTHNIRIVVRDPVGNESASTNVRVTRDTTAPVSPGVRLYADTGDDDGDRLTNQPALVFTGLEAQARWSISVDNGQHWIDSNEPGSSRFNGAGVFDRDGVWTVLTRQIDVAGNISAAGPAFQFTLDRTPPSDFTLRLKHDTGIDVTDRLTRDATVVVEGLDDGETWLFQIDDELQWRTVTDTQEIAHSVFTRDGLHRVTVARLDAAGNRTESSLSFTLDTQAPGAPSLALGSASTSATGVASALAQAALPTDLWAQALPSVWTTEQAPLLG